MTRVDKCEYKGIRYMLWYPKNYVEGKKYPTLFHLHGAGSRGNNFETFEGSSSVLFKVLENGDSELSNGFVIVPQCHGDSWFDFFSDLIDFAKYMYNQPFVDQTRFNGSGVSMGGYGIYQVMQTVPPKRACLVWHWYRSVNSLLLILWNEYCLILHPRCLLCKYIWQYDEKLIPFLRINQLESLSVISSLYRWISGLMCD